MTSKKVREFIFYPAQQGFRSSYVLLVVVVVVVLVLVVRKTCYQISVFLHYYQFLGPVSIYRYMSMLFESLNLKMHAPLHASFHACMHAAVVKYELSYITQFLTFISKCKCISLTFAT